MFPVALLGITEKADGDTWFVLERALRVAVNLVYVLQLYILAVLYGNTCRRHVALTFKV